jgi:hypothetical protein
MSEPTLLPYSEPRNLDQDAWFLYETTSIAYYEMCARLCEEFAHFFNRLLTGHDAHGMGRVDYWVSRYLEHAENIRRGIGFIKLGGDYMPMMGFLGAPSSDFRGLIENAFGYETRDEWRAAFEPMSYACGTGSTTLRNNEWKGLNWLNRGTLGEDRNLLDRNSSHTGDRSTAISDLIEFSLATPPSHFPTHSIDKTIKAKPGDRCVRTGVWVPEQWVNGAGDFSLAFCVEGRPMQPAYRIAGLEKNVVREADPEHGLDEFATYDKVTKAEDTVWYFVHKPDASAEKATNDTSNTLRLRCEAGQPCPREGFWFTPAQVGSRRHFKAGEPMPEVGGDYGATIWQWDPNQAPPQT